jgi:hypothetical protein
MKYFNEDIERTTSIDYFKDLFSKINNKLLNHSVKELNGE